MDIASVMETRKPAQWRLKITLWLDVTLLASVCALQNVFFTGLVLHEWLGLAMAGMVLAHLLLSWSWIASQSSRLFAVQSVRARINYLLNLSLFAAMTALISLIPLMTALNGTNSQRVSRAINRASVVFPTPGGPHKIID